jgi:hypothetical protein
MPYKFQVGQTVQLVEGRHYMVTSAVGYKVIPTASRTRRRTFIPDPANL